MGGTYSMHENMRNAYIILVLKPEGEKLFGRPGRRWENNIRMGLQNIGWEGVDWTYLAEDRDQWRALVYTIMNLRVSKGAGNFFTIWVIIRFSRRTLFHGIS
jgi:hypothetical protein